MHDCAYQDFPYTPQTLSHRYGDHVHVLHDPVLLAELAQLGAKATPPVVVTRLVRNLYLSLVRQMLAHSWPREEVAVPTRMVDSTPRGVWHGFVPSPAHDAVVVAIARAGNVPAQLAYEALGELLGGDRVRQDHLTMGRTTNDRGEVVGVTVHGSKVGGRSAGAIVIVPDPMGATGTSMVEAVKIYKNAPGGPPRKIVAMHLIVTPEYLANMKSAHPDVDVWAVRLDRGMSEASILATEPGSRWAEERGLNAQHYIVPGAGGLGELLNNADV